MYRQTDDTPSRSTLADVFEESEEDLITNRFARSSISTSRFPTDERKASSGSLGADLYLEATGARRSSDTGTVLTADTDSFMIGQRVWVGGVKPGQIAYIGETHFAPGDWAGIVLDEPNGKNDGCVAGKRYFQCEPKRGIFSRLTRLTLYPLPGALLSKEQSPDVHAARMAVTPERSRTVSPTLSLRSNSANKSPAKHGMTVGDRVIVSSGFGSRPGILKYIGETKFAQGNWCGVQLDEPTGKNDGSVDGVRYFECPAKHGIFVPIAKVSLSPTVKKTRLSRAGSKESLTSVGTLNSIATTNTSRLRMNSQKIPTPKIPVNPARSNYSLQDIIREKQNHIEQIMIERELDREDSQNQALNFQKKIFELTNRISELENHLQEEKKKSEDLQNSVDEATFCGDELTAQTQVYKEKITELESCLENLTLNKSSNEALVDKHNEDYKNNAEKEVFLKEETKYLLNRIQELEKDLVSKDEHYEKLISSIRELQALNLELVEKFDDGKHNNEDMSRLKAKIKEKILQFEKLQENLKTEELKGGKKTSKEDKEKNNESISVTAFEEKHQELVRTTKLNEELASKELEALTKMQNLEAQMAKMKTEYDNIIENYMKQNKTLGTEVVTLQGKIDENESVINMLKGKEVELKETLLKIQNLEDKLFTENTKHEEVIAAFKKQIEAITCDNETYKKLINEYQLKLADSQKKEIELKEALQKIAIVEAQLTTKENEICAMKEDYENKYKLWKAENENLEFLVNEKEIALKTLQDDILSKNDIILNKSNKITELESSLSAKSEEYKNLENELENTRIKCKENEELSVTKGKELDSLQLRLDELLKSYDLLNQEFSNQKSQHELVLQELNNLKNTSTTSQSEIITLTARLAEKEEMYAKLLETTDTRRVQLENELQTIISSNEALQAQLSIEISEKDTYKNECENYKSEKCQLQKSTEELKDQISKLQQHVTSIEKSSKGKEEELMKTLQAQLNKETIEKDTYEKKCKQYESERVELEKTIKSLKDQISALQLDLTSVEKSSKEKQDSVVKLLQDQLSKEAAEKDTYEKKCKQYENERLELEKSIQILKGQISALQQDLNYVEKSSKEKQEEVEKALQDQLSKEAADKDTFEKKCKQYENERLEMEKSIENLKGQISALQQDLTNVEKSSKEKQEEVEKALQDQLNKEVAEKDTHEKKCKQYESEKLELQKSIDNLKDQISALQEDLANVEKSSDEKQREVVKVLQDQLSKGAAEKDTYENKCKQYESEKLELEKSIGKLKDQISALQQDLTNVEKSSKEEGEKLVKSLQAQLNKEIAEKDILMNKSKQYDSEKTELEKSLGNLKEQISVLQQDLSNVAKVSKEKEEELVKALQDQVSKEAAEKDMYESKCKQYENEKTELEKSVEKLKVQVTALQEAQINIEQKYKEKEEELVKQNNTLIEENKRFVLSLGEKEGEIVEKNQMHIIISDLQMELSSKSKELEQLRKDMQVIEGSYQDSKEEFKKIQATLLELSSNHEGQIEKIKQQLKEMEEEQVDLVKENHDLKEQISHLEKEQSSLIAKNNNEIRGLRNAEAMNAKLIKENEELKSKLQREIINQASNENLMKLNNPEKQNIIQSEHSKCGAIISKLEEQIKSLNDKLKAYEAYGNLDKETLPDAAVSDGEALSQINFLNSIIADMQKKNDTLKAKIDTLESFSKDFTYSLMFDNLTKRKPAPRVFCDMCDQWDLHDTEDCPIQCSESPVPFLDNDEGKNKEKPPPRKYCENCEVFGHEAADCAQDETY